MTRPAVLSALLALVACGPAVKQIEVTPGKVALESVGATATLEAVVRDHGGGALVLPVRWSSSRPEVAEVDAAGRVTARKSGEAEVRVSAAGLERAVPVQITIPARAELTPPALVLTGVPSSQPLLLQLRDDAGREIAPRSVTWRSSDESVVRVAAGTVTAVAPGQAQVSAGAAGLTATAAVEVRLPPFAAVKVEPSRLSLPAGESARVAAVAVDAGGQPVAGVPLRFGCSDERVARVGADGTVTAVRKGKAKVTASAGGRSAAVEVTVRK